MADNNPSSLRIDTVDWNKDSDICAFVDQAMTDKESYCRVDDLQAMWNMTWYRGYQNLQVDGRTGQLQRIPAKKNQVRLVYNTMLPDIEAYCANLGADVIEYECNPATQDSDEVQRAKLRSQVLRYYQDTLELNDTIEESDRGLVLTGEECIKVCWDPDAGTEFDFLAAAGVETEEEFERVHGAKPPKALGDIHVSYVPRTDMFWGPYGCKFKEKDFLVQAYDRSIAEVVAKYKVKAEDLPRGDGSQTVYRPTDIGPSGIQGTHNEDNQTVRISEIWIRKGAPGCPDGQHAIVCGSKVLKKGPNPYKHGRIPYEFNTLLFLPGHNRGFTPVDSLLSPQADYNRNMSQQVQVRQTMSNPRILAKMGAVPNPEQWSGEAGGINEYVGDTPPIVWQGASSPASVFVNLDKTRRCAQDIIGVRDVSSAKVPTGVKSGIAIRALKEADDARYNTISKRRRAMWQRVGYLMLQTIEQYVSEERVIQITGKDDAPMTIRYIGSDLSPSDAATRYNVRIATTGMPRSKLAQLELMQTLSDKGWLSPDNPDDKRTFFRMLELGDMNSAFDPAQEDRDVAREENELIMEGQQITASESDNHDVHIYEHQALEKKPSFRARPPQEQALLRAHINSHIETRFYTQFKLEAMGKIQYMKVQQQFGLAPPPGAAPQQPMQGTGGDMSLEMQPQTQVNNVS